MTKSKQHVKDDPLNKPDWEIYPKEDDSSPVEFDMAQVKIPGAHPVSKL
jgi:hypothetical protein